MRDYKKEYEERVAFIRDLLEKSGAKGIVYGNSGGKDSALVGILCKAACDNTVGIIMPCSSKRNFGQDAEDARIAADQYGIETRFIDLTPVREAEMQQLSSLTEVTPAAAVNIAPPSPHDYAVRGGCQRGKAGCRHRQPQRGLRGLLHQVG